MKSQHCGLIVSVVLVKDDVESSSPMCAFLREQALSVSKFHTRNHKREGVVGMTWCCLWNICCSSQTHFGSKLFCAQGMGRSCSQNHRVVEVGKDIWRSESNTCSGPCPIEFWISPKMVMPDFLGNLCQCLSTHGRKVSSYFWIEFPVFQNLYLLPLVPSPLRRVWLSSLLPHCVFLHSGECVYNDVMSKALLESRLVHAEQARTWLVWQWCHPPLGRSTAPVAPHTGNSLLPARSFGLVCKSANEALEESELCVFSWEWGNVVLKLPQLRSGAAVRSRFLNKEFHSVCE